MRLPSTFVANSSAGYPPDFQDGAVQTVLRQAEALSTNLASEFFFQKYYKLK